MLELDRLTGASEWIVLDFLEREATPEPAMKLGIQMHLAELSLADTVRVLDCLGVKRHRATVHRWVKKADLQPNGRANPNQVALDETVIQLNDQQYWLYAAVAPATNRLLHVRLYPTRTTAITEMFLVELREKHLVAYVEVLVDSAPWLQAALRRHWLRFQHETHGNRNAVEHVFRELKRRTTEFSNSFSHVKPETADSWLQAFGRCHNALI